MCALILVLEIVPEVKLLIIIGVTARLLDMLSVLPFAFIAWDFLRPSVSGLPRF